MSNSLDADDIFLGRHDDQERFRETLRAVKREANVVEKVKDWVTDKDPVVWPFVFLLHGEGGMGKSRLAGRFRDITTTEPEFKGFFRAVHLDWERRKERDLRLVARDAVAAETVFDNLYSVFRDEGFGREFDPYEKAVATRGKAETAVSQALDRAREGGDRYAPLRELGGKGLAWLVRTGTPLPIPEEPMARTFEAIIGGGAEGLARARESATMLVRSALKNPDEFDLFTQPEETLARRLGDGIRASASRKPVVLVLDTYEIADRADPWLKVVIKRAGPCAVWIIAGRDNLADSRSRYGQSSFIGYRAEFPSDRLRVSHVGEFSVNDVAAYFSQRAPERPIEIEAARAIHQATLGIPLAVREAAAIWKAGVSLDDIVGGVPARAPHKDIVNLMTERFLLHCLTGPHADDRFRLYALALASSPDPDLLAAMLQTGDLEKSLSELERRYSFVFVSEMKLHDSVAAFVRHYLAQDIHRKSPAVRDLHQRAAECLRARLAKLEADLPLIENRCEDADWVQAALDLAHHLFWLDESEAWRWFAPRFVEGLAYNRDLRRGLRSVAQAWQNYMSKSGQQRCNVLSASASWSPTVEEDSPMLDELGRMDRLGWLSGAGEAERRAILDLQRGRLLYRQEKHKEALAMYDKAEGGLPKEGAALKIQMGEALHELACEFMWPQGRSDAVFSAEAERILSKAVLWLPDNQEAWYRLGVALVKQGSKLNDAIAAFQRAIELDPKFAYPHNGLGSVYRDLGRHDDAIAAYQRAIELDPKYAYPHHGLGSVYAALGRHDDAIAAYQRAIELDPKDAAPHHGLGSVYAALSRHDDAIAAFQRAIELDPKLAYPHNGLGSVYRDLSRHDDAIAAFQRAIELDPKLAYPHHGLGNVYRDLGRHDDAIAAFQRAIELDPKFAYPHHGLGSVYRDLSRHDDAIAAFQRAIELDPKYAYPHNGLGNVYRILRRYDEAIAAFEGAIKLDPNNATSHASLAACYRKVEREAEANEQIAVARKLIARETEYNRACLEAICGNADEALALLKTALEKKQVGREWARRDPDFEALWDDPRFEELFHPSSAIRHSPL